MSLYWTTVHFRDLLLQAVIGVCGSRQRRLVAIRVCWGRAPPRSQRAIGLAALHTSRLAATPTGRGLDDRTWTDLNLDEVFVALDHTQSTLGQHALYHRLRTAPLGDHLDAFESLVSALSGDAAARERAPLALAPLQDADGYNLWWMLDGGALARRGWYRVFPCLTAAAFIAIVLAPLWPWALVMLIVNVAVRYRTDALIAATGRCARPVEVETHLALHQRQSVHALRRIEPTGYCRQ